MISTKQKSIAMCVLAIVAVLALFISAPLFTTHQAHAHFWGGWGWGGGCGGCCGGCGCGFGGCWANLW